MKKLMTVALATMVSSAALAQGDLYSTFKNPGASARPRVWWHWMNGNITQEGIRKDLLWMHRSGIGGFHNFDGALMVPPIVKDRLVYMTPGWKQAFALTTKLADSLKLEMAIAGSPGWSESGGPWVKPEDGMKKMVWSETRISGGASNIKLPAPPKTTGPFQDLTEPVSAFAAGPAKEAPAYYADAAVIAYRLPASDRSMAELNPAVTSSGGQFTLAQLTDGVLSKSSMLPRDDAKGYAWIQFSFASPVTIKAVTIVGGGDRGQFGLAGELADNRWLEFSNDGTNFTKGDFLPASRNLQQTVAVRPITGKFIRVVFKNPEANNAFAAFGGPQKPPAGTEVAEIMLSTAGRVHWSEEKSGFAANLNIPERVTPETGDAIDPKDVVVLTDRMRADGSLDWTAPEGNWNIIRFGYSLTGKENGPAPAEATGLEVDKLDPAAIKRYFTTYLDMYKDASKGMMGAKGGLTYMMNDSWEANTQNWTGNFPAEFKKRRGYDLMPWLPAVAGKVVGSAEQTDAFLRDFRRTIGDMVVEYHYDMLTDILASYGMKRYTESHEDGTAMIGDGMEVKRKAAIPMSAMWTPSMMGDGLKYRSDIRESAAVAHIYGQNIVAAESLTALGLGGNAWSYVPSNLKPVADMEMAHGLNRFVIHTSVHQPLENPPGIGLGPFGQWFNRHDTWSGKAKAWTDYLSRSSHLLQQGKFVADIVYYYGQDNNITGLYRFALPNLPVGYNYDFINRDALESLLSVKDGRFVTPSGMSYRVLVLDSNSRRMSMSVLRKLRDMVKAGGTITGAKPETPFSLMDDKTEFNAIVTELWGNGEEVRSVGNGKVYAGFSTAKALSDLRTVKDFSYAEQGNDPDILYVHRTMPGQDIYWVNNRTDKYRAVEADFRVSGREVEIWHPETGAKEPASYISMEGITKVTLNLTPNDAVFVVFAGPNKVSMRRLGSKSQTTISKLEGPWTVNFQADRGAPASTTFEKLTDWTEHADPGIKYFSGTARYIKTLKVDAKDFAKGETWLDLGVVKDLAEVFVNGKSAGVTWKVPYRVNVTGLLKAGENKIEIEVVDRWVNRLIGDAQPGVKKITYTTMPFYNAKDKLVPAGLLGPVKLVNLK